MLYLARWTSLATVLACSTALLACADPSSAERGVLRLYLLQNPVGYERYEVVPEGDHLVMKADVDMSDRGGPLPVTATLSMRDDYTPERFTIKGKTYRYVNLDADVTLEKDAAVVRVNDRPRKSAVGRRGFTVHGFAPLAAQMMLVRYWNAHGRPQTIPLLPAGEAHIARRGSDVVQIGGRAQTLERYSVDGVMWGGESIWLDADGALVAATTYTGNLPFQAVREGYEAALGTFVARAVEDRMMDLQRNSSTLAPAPMTGTVAVIGAKLVDGTGRPALDDSAIVIRKGRIVAVGRRGSVSVPADATVVDGQGKTAIPGLWEMHAHFANIEWAPTYLAAGVTTARDTGDEIEFLTAVRDTIVSGRGIGPRLLLAGFVDGAGAEGLGAIRADTPEQARAVVQRYHRAGFQQIKLYSLVKSAIVRELATEAHRLGMKVTGHVPTGMTPRDAVNAGFDEFAHLPPIGDPKSPEGRDLIAFFRQHGTAMTTTESWSELQGHAPATPIRSFEPGFDKMPPPLNLLYSTMGAQGIDEQTAQSRRARSLAAIRALHDAGIPIVAGSDKGVPGHSVHRELELYVQAGLTPMEALQAATVVPARVMGLERETGTIEAGKSADLVLLDANPLDRISNIRTARIVIARGQVLDTAMLWKMAGFAP